MTRLEAVNDHQMWGYSTFGGRELGLKDWCLVHPFSQSLMLRYSDVTEDLDFAATIVHFSSDVYLATLAHKYKRSTVSFFIFPSLISIMVSMDVKHHVYLLTSSCVSLICQPDI